ncbi:uncharacterized protein LOC110929538 [Helianthus annuus]|uniref:uncharacterized protein LOC110929538 n=1 Tax=Helianthus annuus TaxID=4232 RepID=UPI000B900D04|nr:uncharacterized protein LOC110929538 [Helianthus annuus]
MTFEPLDILSMSNPQKTQIHTANNGTMQVKGGGTIEISPTMKLSNCLYVPSLSHKLLSISYITKELNCTVLMHPTFCLLLDIRTGVIIGRGTDRQGLYYVDEVARQGTVILAHGTENREAWIWHRRLGHPSNGEHIEPTTTEPTPQAEPDVEQGEPDLEEVEKVVEHVEPVAAETTGRYPLPPRANKGAKAFVTSLYSEQIPGSVKEAQGKKNWKEALETDMQALMKNNTWEKCIPPKGKKTVGCRGCIQLSINQMVLLEDTKLDL